MWWAVGIVLCCKLIKLHLHQICQNWLKLLRKLQGGRFLWDTVYMWGHRGSYCVAILRTLHAFIDTLKVYAEIYSISASASEISLCALLVAASAILLLLLNTAELVQLSCCSCFSYFIVDTWILIFYQIQPKTLLQSAHWLDQIFHCSSSDCNTSDCNSFYVSPSFCMYK